MMFIQSRSIFERHHRFVGWVALFMTCMYTDPSVHTSVGKR